MNSFGPQKICGHNVVKYSVLVYRLKIFLFGGATRSGSPLSDEGSIDLRTVVGGAAFAGGAAATGAAANGDEGRDDLKLAAGVPAGDELGDEPGDHGLAILKSDVNGVKISASLSLSLTKLSVLPWWVSAGK